MIRSASLLAAVVLTLPTAPTSRSAPALPGKTPPPAATVHRALEPQESLPLELRTFMQQRMRGHAEAMVDLLMAVTLLRTDLAAGAANRIATEPRLARPSAGELDTTNAQLSERFFLLQDELRMRARAVGEAAAAKDPERVANRFGALATVCVRCHAAYLQPAREPAVLPSDER